MSKGEEVSKEKKDDDHTYSVPLCADGECSSVQIVAAFVDVWLTFYWLEKKWISDVNMYSAAIPLTVMMF